MLRGYWQRLISSPASTQWKVLIVGGFAVAVVLGLLMLAASAAVNPEGTADTPPAPEKTAQEAETTSKEKPAQEASKPRRKPRPEPHVPQARILWILKRDYYEERSTTVQVETLANGCKVATVNYETPFVGSTLPYEPPEYYEAIYTDPELQSQICLVRTNAYGTKTDDYGNKHKVLLLTTSMDRATAQKINWKNSFDVNFARLYRTEYIHPSVQAEISRELARKAADCAQDEGMFDFDFDC